MGPEGFDKKAYQCRYMREKRARERALAETPAERRRRWEMRAEEMHAIAEGMRSPEARAMMESVARHYDWLASKAGP